MRKIWFEEAWEDYLYWQVQDKKTLKRINVLIRDIERGSFDGIGKPEPLRGDLSGFWSRRIDDTNTSRRSLGRVSVPVWLFCLSAQLCIVALVSHYLTN